MRIVYWLCGIVAAVCMAFTVVSALVLVFQIVAIIAAFIGVCWLIIYAAKAFNKLKKKPPE